MEKKAQLQGLTSLAIGIATVSIALIVTFLIISTGASEIRTIEGVPDYAVEGNSTSVALNATYELTRAVDDIPGWLPLIVIAVIGSILLGVVTLFSRRR